MQAAGEREERVTDTADKIKRLLHLDSIAADLERAILAGRGDVAHMRAEWQNCQNEALALEVELADAGAVFVDDSGWVEAP